MLCSVFDGNVVNKNDVFSSMMALCSPSQNYPSIIFLQKKKICQKSHKKFIRMLHAIATNPITGHHHQIWLNTQFKEAWLIAKCICVHSMVVFSVPARKFHNETVVCCACAFLSFDQSVIQASNHLITVI